MKQHGDRVTTADGVLEVLPVLVIGVCALGLYDSHALAVQPLYALMDVTMRLVVVSVVEPLAPTNKDEEGVLDPTLLHRG